MIRRPPRSTQSRSSAASDVYKRQVHIIILLGTYRSIHTDSTSIGFETVLNLFRNHLKYFSYFLRRGFPFIFLFQSCESSVYAVNKSDFIDREPYDPCLFSKRLEYRLTNPPYSIRDKFKASCLIKTLCCFHQTKVTLIDQIRNC